MGNNEKINTKKIIIKANNWVIEISMQQQRKLFKSIRPQLLATISDSIDSRSNRIAPKEESVRRSASLSLDSSTKIPIHVTEASAHNSRQSMRRYC